MPKADITMIFNQLQKLEKPQVEVWINTNLENGLSGTEYEPKKTMLYNIHSTKVRLETAAQLEACLS